MPDSQDPKQVNNNDLRNAQFGGGLINAESLNAGRIGGDIYNTKNIHITNYYREDIRIAAVQPTSDTSSDEKLPCPYRGLFHFSPDDAEYFFGREVFIEELSEATKTRNFIFVLGASGSGKSSVVFAGLVPKLQQQGHWLFTHFRPGSEPFYALAQALVPLYEPEINATEQMYQARQLSEYLVNGSVLLKDVFQRIERNYVNHRILLIADQFEELYTLCNDDKIRRSFLNCLLKIIPSPVSQFSSSTVLIATMRADFLGNALSYPPLRDVLQADIKLGAMNREELLQVIEKPALKLGVTFQDGLVERIFDDVDTEPGNLPLLEFALTLLWEKRQDRQLTHAAYKEIGEVQGAIANYADKKYGELSSTDRERAQRIFIQLVRPGERTGDRRRLATKAELGEDNWSLVQHLANARLVVTNHNANEQETVEVVHEALIREWDKLSKSIKSDRIFRTWQEGLRFAMRQWQTSDHDEGVLLRGAPLVEAEDWLQQRSDEISQPEWEFIQSSLAVRDRLDHEEEERTQRELDLIRENLEQEQKARKVAQKARKVAQRTTTTDEGFAINDLVGNVKINQLGNPQKPFPTVFLKPRQRYEYRLPQARNLNDEERKEVYEEPVVQEFLQCDNWDKWDTKEWAKEICNQLNQYRQALDQQFYTSPAVKVTEPTIDGIPIWLSTIDLNNPQTIVTLVPISEVQKAGGLTSFAKSSNAALIASGTFKSDRNWTMKSGGRFIEGEASKNWSNYTVLGLKSGNQPEMNARPKLEESQWNQYWFALTGHPRLVTNKKPGVTEVASGSTLPIKDSLERTAIGFSSETKKLYHVITKKGVSLDKLATVMKALGCDEAMNLEGGNGKVLAQKNSLLVSGEVRAPLIVVYDAQHPAPDKIREAWASFQLGKLP